MELGKFIERAANLGVICVMVTQDGELIAKHNWDDDSRRNVYSASKSFTSAAVGIAQAEGLLSLEERLVDVFAKDLPEQVSENLEAATVRDLLTMCLGQEKGFLMGPQRPAIREENWAKLSLAQPFACRPGERFVYNNVGPYLAGLLVQQRAGCDLVSYLMPRLFAPLDIPRPTWEVDRQGNTFGAGGLFLNAIELSRFGQLYLQKGSWRGRQLIPSDWVEESGRKQVENGQDGYGYLFWRGPHGSYRADGKYCQWAIVIEKKNAVITTMCECRNGEALAKAVWEEIYPQL